MVAAKIGETEMLILLRRIGEKPELKIGEDSTSGRLADATDPHALIQQIQETQKSTGQNKA